MSYRAHFAPLLSAAERTLFRKLSSPHKIQDYLDSLPINFETSGETYFSPRRVIREGVAHCFEGALMAAAALAWHDSEPLIMDLKTAKSDTDHVVTLFRHGRHWGAMSKTNHSVLRWRDPVYASPREIAMSYFHEYFLSPSGKKTLRSYSAPFSLAHVKTERWLTAEEDLHWLALALDRARHFPTVPEGTMRLLRHASKIEIEASDMIEWRSATDNPYK